jgi:hypothetical protein
MAVKYSKNFQRQSNAGLYLPRKSNEFGSRLNGLLGSASGSISAATSQQAAPFTGNVFWSGSAPSWTEVVGHGVKLNAFHWYPDASTWNFDRDHGLDSWHCWRFSMNGVKSAGGRIRAWMDSKPLVDLQAVDLRGMQDSQIDSIYWNHYYNTADGTGRYEGPTPAYRYEDNVVISTASDPVTCESIGFNFGASSQPPPGGTPVLGAPGQPRLIP